MKRVAPALLKLPASFFRKNPSVYWVTFELNVEHGKTREVSSTSNRAGTETVPR